MNTNGNPCGKHAAAVCCAVSILCALTLLAGGMLVHLPEAMHIETSAVVSGSMEPAIPKGSMVFVDTHKKEPKTGAVMTYRKNSGMIVTHRVYRIEEDGSVLMKGDANNVPDPCTVADSDLIGTVTGTVPLLGTVLERPACRLILTGLMAVSGSAGLLIQTQTKEKGEKQA